MNISNNKSFERQSQIKKKKKKNSGEKKNNTPVA